LPEQKDWRQALESGSARKIIEQISLAWQQGDDHLAADSEVAITALKP
jgi:hypothetical protein